WATKRASELIVSERRLRIGIKIKDVSSVEFVVTEKLEQGTVKIVCSRLGDDVHSCAAVTTKLGFDVCLYGSFRNGLDWQNGCGSSEHAGFVDRRQVSVAVVHVRAIEQVIVCAPAIAVRAEQSERAGRIGCP